MNQTVSKDKIHFRQLTPADEKILQQFYQDVCKLVDGKRNLADWEYGVYPMPEDIQNHLSEQSFYGLFLDDVLAAAGAVCFSGQPGYETINWKIKEGKIATWHLVAVHPKYRKQNLAKTLLQHFIEDFAYDAVHIDCVPHNEPAISLYTSLGFDDLGLVTIYYPDTDWAPYRMLELVPEKKDSSLS